MNLFILAAIVSHTLHVVSTGDVHGSWFDQPYNEGGKQRTSLMAVNKMVTDLRNNVGADNVLLLDAGDALQGDQAAYYYNYVDTLKPHLYPRLVSYMKYDALVVGNHDIETGHKVYDRIHKELSALKIPYLAGNALTPEEKPYFDEYTVVERAGLKVLVLGFTNPNIKAWLAEEKWSGMRFENLIPLVQRRVDEIKKTVKPQLTILVVHSGTGKGDGKILESQGLDLFESIQGVDLLITSHDHTPVCKDKPGFSLMNCGSNCKNVGHAIIEVETSGKKVVGKKVMAGVRPIEARYSDAGMRSAYKAEFEAVKAFTMRHVGNLSKEIRIRDSYAGPSSIMNLIHTVQLSVPEAKLSFSAPLTFDGTVPAGELVYRDMFTLYKFENELYVVNMTGKEIKDYLEYSYNNWIETGEDHILKIVERPDQRTGSKRWSFRNPSYNFDSCAGLIYSVDITKPFGNRIEITSLADGSSFNPEATYPVAMTSYRANGGGGILPKGAGITSEILQDRLVATYPAIRDLLYEFIRSRKTLDEKSYSDQSVLGNWKFIPESKAEKLMEKDFELLFGKSK